MMLKEEDRKKLEEATGKTVKDIDLSGFMVSISFTDGSCLELWCNPIEVFGSPDAEWEVC